MIVAFKLWLLYRISSVMLIRVNVVHMSIKSHSLSTLSYRVSNIHKDNLYKRLDVQVNFPFGIFNSLDYIALALYL